ncbi:MAG TPA: hypothetical protein ENK57_21455 [Polyangiaceae bacterium]|nr:hypothetical protein [Polyangiaceae bacterium]
MGRMLGRMRLCWIAALLVACSTPAGDAPPDRRGGGSAGSGGSVGGEVSPPAPDPQPFAHELRDEQTFDRLASRPENQVVARTAVVKFLIDLQDGRRLYFVDTDRWDIHYEFAAAVLNTEQHPVEQGYEGHRRFNEIEYRTEGRRFVCGSVVHYLDADQWTFEMIAGDNLTGERVLRAFEQVRDATYFGAQLRYRPISALHEHQIASVAGRLPTISAEDVFGGIRYQPLTRGVAFGTLRFVRGPLDAASVRPDQILVLDELPDEIPVASAVISRQMQAPLGHLAILCATRSTPNAGLRDALDDPRLAALEGQLVRLTIGTQDFQIRAAELSEAQASWASRRPERPVSPTINRADTGLPELCSLSYSDANTVGAKAAQLGEACQIGGVIVTPGGFAIPFFHYLQHLRRTGLAAGIPQMLDDPAFRRDARVREQRLLELRTAIERAPVSPRLLRALRRRIRAFPGEPRVILRSSTNAEDLPGFTGAGLYRSIVIAGDADDAELSNALRRVWASVWLQGAYEEREWFRIDHREVAMAVLVQPFVDGAAANGVAITANPYYENRPAYFVNVQALGGSVTGAAGDEIPEQHLIYTYQGIEPELVSRSSRDHGAPLMREEEILDLAEVLRVLHEHFAPRWGDRVGRVPEGSTYVVAAEVEFLVAGPDRDVVVLQARPFVVTYTAGQQ